MEGWEGGWKGSGKDRWREVSKMDGRDREGRKGQKIRGELEVKMIAVQKAVSYKSCSVSFFVVVT